MTRKDRRQLQKVSDHGHDQPIQEWFAVSNCQITERERERTDSTQQKTFRKRSKVYSWGKRFDLLTFSELQICWSSILRQPLAISVTVTFACDLRQVICPNTRGLPRGSRRGLHNSAWWTLTDEKCEWPASLQGFREKSGTFGEPNKMTEIFMFVCLKNDAK